MKHRPQNKRQLKQNENKEINTEKRFEGKVKEREKGYHGALRIAGLCDCCVICRAGGFAVK